MSNSLHRIARNQGSARPRRVVSQVQQSKGGFRWLVTTLSKPQHRTGSPWWRDRFADLVERRRVAAKTGCMPRRIEARS